MYAVRTHRYSIFPFFMDQSVSEQLAYTVAILSGALVTLIYLATSNDDIAFLALGKCRASALQLARVTVSVLLHLAPKSSNSPHPVMRKSLEYFRGRHASLDFLRNCSSFPAAVAHTLNPRT